MRASPSTGYGVYASMRVYPAPAARRAAESSSGWPVNSASSPEACRLPPRQRGGSRLTGTGTGLEIAGGGSGAATCGARSSRTSVIEIAGASRRKRRKSVKKSPIVPRNVAQSQKVGQ